MDLLHTNQMIIKLNMSKLQFEIYSKAYQELMSGLVELHNSHIEFKKTVGRRAGNALKISNRKVILLCKALNRTILGAHREQTNNNKIIRKRNQTREELLATRRVRERKITNHKFYKLK